MSNKTVWERRLVYAATSLLMIVWSTLRFGIAPVEAARISDIRGTKHNLSASYSDGSIYTLRDGSIGTVPTRTTKATSTTTGSEICVFCHTPHGATSTIEPLWNRRVAGTGYSQSYTTYTSSSLDALQIQTTGLDQPGGSSKLCLSCHDGTVAIGNVNVLNGGATNNSDKTVSNIATSTTYMPTGGGLLTGFTRNLGVDLTNDHPISVTYNSTLAGYDGELRSPPALDSNNTTLAAVRSKTVKPKLPLEATNGGNQIQCATCHDPHVRETAEASVGNQKFLRLNRFQELNPPSTTGFVSTDNSGDIICLACHDKNNGGGSWAYSAHANPLVADESYSTIVGGAADRREFPRGLAVWKAACLNCHDTHTVSGATRLLREATNEGTTTTASAKAGGAGTAAQEEACYQCHDGGTNATLAPNTSVPNIKGDFGLSYRMPITVAAQGTSGGGGGNTTEVHDISSAFTSDGIMSCSAGDKCGKDFIEPRSKLGLGNLKNRHVECTDCHNPHRMIRGDSGLPGTLNSTNTSVTRVNGGSGGHHKHTDDANTSHTNVISGVLRGTWGVQPTYSGTDPSFHSLPTGYVVKRGDPGSDAVTDCADANKATCDGKTYVTREYQICLKCHSDYGYSDDNTYPTSGNRPKLAGSNLTAADISRKAGTYTTYTNQAKEFQPPTGHRGEGTAAVSGGYAATYSSNNHRSWHPVIDSTGRTGTIRGNGTDIKNNWRAPWNNNVGNQTMYCTDCHGSVTGGTTAIPTGTNPWGPHGSGNIFLLKGPWSTSTGAGSTNDLCFRCHDPARYVQSSNNRTGFWVSRGSVGPNQDGHSLHNSKGGTSGRIRCNWCHIAVPHGWKNKALLVNLKDVGPEAGQTAGTEIADSTLTPSSGGNAVGFSNGPYYRNAMLKVKNFALSGQWSIGDCGNGSDDNASRAWMKDNICKNPP